MRNLYAGQEATVRTENETVDWFKIGKSLYIVTMFNLYAEFITQNARLDVSQAGIKISGRNINNLRYEDDTTLMVESREELKSPLIQVKEESEKSGLKSLSKNEDHGILSHHFIANRWGNNGNNERLYFLGLQNHCRW